MLRSWQADRKKRSNKNTKVLMIYLVIFYIWFFFFSYNKNHLKTQQQKSSCKNSVPAGIRTRDLRHRLENQKGDFSQTRSAFSTGSYWPILLIFNSKHWKTTKFLVYKFEENRTKITAMRVPHRKNAKWPPWRHQIEISKIWEKCHRPMSSRLFVWNFIEFGPAV